MAAQAAKDYATSCFPGVAASAPCALVHMGIVPASLLLITVKTMILA